MKELITKHIHSLGTLFHALNFFDIDFCRENTADLAMAKMIIDCELKYRLHKLDSPDSGFIRLNRQYWFKFNSETISSRFTLFTHEKLLMLIKELFDRDLYKIKGNLSEEEILILLEE